MKNRRARNDASGVFMVQAGFFDRDYGVSGRQ